MIYIIICAAVIAADQLVKYLIVSAAETGETLFSLGLFGITYVKNEGAAFSMLSGRMTLLSVISIIFCICVTAYLIWKKPKQPLLRISLTLLLAGAAANAVDRIARGFVVDYIQATFINFPVFNIADIAITIGAALLVLYEIVYDKDDKKNKKDK